MCFVIAVSFLTKIHAKNAILSKIPKVYTGNAPLDRKICVKSEWVWGGGETLIMGKKSRWNQRIDHTDRENNIFPVQLATSRIGNHTRLIPTLAICDGHTYVLTRGLVL